MRIAAVALACCAAACGGAPSSPATPTPTGASPTDATSRAASYLASLPEADLTDPESHDLAIGAAGMQGTGILYASIAGMYAVPDLELPDCAHYVHEEHDGVTRDRLTAEDCLIQAGGESPQTIAGEYESTSTPTTRCGVETRVRWGRFRASGAPKCDLGNGAIVTSSIFQGEGTFNECGFRLSLLVESTGPQLVGVDCEPSGDVAIEYVGTIRVEPGVGRVFEGEGTLGVSNVGRVQLRTDSEVMAGQDPDPGVCVREALSGTTSVTAGGHELQVRYDGATQCDADGSKAPVFLDGAPAGYVTTACAASGSGAPWTSLGLVVVVLSFLRRRARSSRA